MCHVHRNIFRCGHAYYGRRRCSSGESAPETAAAAQQTAIFRAQLAARLAQYAQRQEPLDTSELAQRQLEQDVARECDRQQRQQQQQQEQQLLRPPSCTGVLDTQTRMPMVCDACAVPARRTADRARVEAALVPLMQGVALGGASAAEVEAQLVPLLREFGIGGLSAREVEQTLVPLMQGLGRDRITPAEVERTLVPLVSRMGVERLNRAEVEEALVPLMRSVSVQRGEEDDALLELIRRLNMGR